MNKLTLILVSFLAISSSFAQIVYESPHTQGGKSIRLVIPDGFYPVTSSSTVGYTIYSTQEGLDFEKDKVKTLHIGSIVIAHVETNGKTFDDFVPDFEEKVIRGSQNAIVLSEPETVSINNHKCMLAGLKGDMGGQRLAALYFGIIEYGGHFMITTYNAIEGTDEILEYEEFKDIMKTISEAETGSEFSIPPPKESVIHQILMDHYKNDLFETEFSPLDILPELTEHWSPAMEGNSHLLAEYDFKRNRGSVKIFSGGPALNYSSEEDMEEAIKLVVDSLDSLKLNYDSYVTNEFFGFNLYSVEAGGVISSVYTSELNKELLFFVFDEGPNPEEGFKNASVNFMQGMFLNYFE